MPASHQLPTIAFGGEGPSLHFAHANGYPPACYRQFLSPLTAHFTVWAMEQRPLWPGQDASQLRSWTLFAADFIRLLEQRAEGAIIAVGHSLGAVVSMMAAQERPDLFTALVLIEPVLLPPALLQAAREHPQQAANRPLTQRALNRRNHWPSRQHAFDRFRGKGVFKRVPDEVLWDYVEHALADAPDGGVRLRYPREWEAQIYSRPPVDIWELPSQITTPTLAIRGEHSDTLLPAEWRRWQTLQPQAEFVELDDCGHLAPLERPATVRELTLSFLERAAT